MDAAPHNDTPVEDLKNLGKKSARMLNEIGIYTRRDLQNAGVTMAYKILQHRFPGVSILFLYSMYGALEGCHWNHLPPGVKETLREAAATPLNIIPGSFDAA